MRLPTGVQNIVANYRSGIGQAGNVDAGQISMLQTRPLGVKDVINPLRASGGADRENIDQARSNAPLAVMSLDRLVSVQDYADFARTFAGIGKAASVRKSVGRRELVEITIAGASDIPIDINSDLYQNLVIALRDYGDPALPVQVDVRELVILVASVRIALMPDYQWESATASDSKHPGHYGVAATVRAAMLDTFSFERRNFGQPALLSELIALIQTIAGVQYVDVVAFGGIPEKVANPDGTRRLLTLDEMSKAVIGITTAAQRVDVNEADLEEGVIRPAQLGIFSAAVQDTIVLNQIV
jgi:predicted phage baseplate assembly protein